MVTVFYVKHSGKVQTRNPMHDRAVAEAHAASIAQYFAADEPKPEVVEAQTDHLPGSIWVKGSTIGYQYNRESMGGRTYRGRQIRKLHRGPDKRYYGEAVIEGRIVEVSSTHLGGLWFAERMLGYTE